MVVELEQHRQLVEIELGHAGLLIVTEHEIEKRLLLLVFALDRNLRA